MLGKALPSPAYSGKESPTMKRKANHITTIVLVLILLVGLSLLLYPSVSDYWNSFHSSRAISAYAEDVANLDEVQYEEMWSAARA